MTVTVALPPLGSAATDPPAETDCVLAAHQHHPSMPTPEPDPAESPHVEMVCTCLEEGSAAAGAALYERVKEALTRGSMEPRPREVTDRTCWDDCPLSLSADFNATVREILYDQWAAVVVRSGPPGGPTS